MIPGGDKIQLINLNSLNDKSEILESIPYTFLKMLRRPENGNKKKKENLYLHFLVALRLKKNGLEKNSDTLLSKHLFQVKDNETKSTSLGIVQISFLLNLNKY